MRGGQDVETNGIANIPEGLYILFANIPEGLYIYIFANIPEGLHILFASVPEGLYISSCQR